MDSGLDACWDKERPEPVTTTTYVPIEVVQNGDEQKQIDALLKAAEANKKIFDEMEQKLRDTEVRAEELRIKLR